MPVIDNHNDEEEGDDLGNTLLAIMAEVAHENPGVSEAALTYLLRERLRAHFRWPEFEKRIQFAVDHMEDDADIFARLLDDTKHQMSPPDLILVRRPPPAALVHSFIVQADLSSGKPSLSQAVTHPTGFGGNWHKADVATWREHGRYHR